MKHLCLFLFGLIHFTFAQTPTENYPVDPDSEEQPGVPKGEILKFTFEQSKVFPGTWREYWVYVPAQYNPDKPACVYVNQDGIQWKAPTVFDNLIHKKEMPVTIGIFVMHGRVKAANPNEANDRFNRSFEYDGLGDGYARFILDEILPEVEKQKTADGRAIRLSKSGNDRAIGGSSSGAVCAFTAAWERPDAFTRVFSAIGTYVGLRGADRYPTLARKTEPKPIRIFLQDGSQDLNIYAGDWWMANQTMLRALTFAGYEVTHKWGEGGHNGKQGTAIFPEAMKYLWKDWPVPVKKGKSQNQVLSSILVNGQDWEQVEATNKHINGLVVNREGEVSYPDIRKNNLLVAHNGNGYISVPNGMEKPGRIYLVKPSGKKTVVDEGLLFCNGLALSPDQTILYAAESATHWIWSYQVQPDGTLKHKQKFGWLHTRDEEDAARAEGLTCDREGRIYVATRAGIQVLDQTGRVNAILPIPNGAASNVAFGGKDFDTLYVTANGKVFRRKLIANGANSWDKPNKPDNPKL